MKQLAMDGKGPGGFWGYWILVLCGSYLGTAVDAGWAPEPKFEVV